jgi:hypothetical protein
MKFYRKIITLFALLLLAGMVKKPWEAAIGADLRHDKLLSEPLNLTTRESIGQTSSAVALGGLRSVVASFWNIRAYTSFEESNWVKLEDQDETIVALQPHTAYYWDTGSWHLAYNAAVSSRENENFPAPRREALHRTYINKGKAFLERGVKNMPGNWILLSSLGRLHGTASKYPDYEKSAAAYQQAWETGKARNFEARAWFYSLARCEGKDREALHLGRALFIADKNRVDTLCCLLFVLEMRQKNARPIEELVKLCFTSHADALRMLEVYKTNNAENLPITGVDHAIEWLKSVQNK